jgi:hypothetical protein
MRCITNKSCQMGVEVCGIIKIGFTLHMVGFWFAFCKTLAETLFLNTIANIFLMPLIIKFTIISNLKTNIEIPKGLHFHENQMIGKKF